MAVSWLRDAPAAQPLALYLVSAFGSGVCIGATGIGGVLLVPLLLLMGVPIGVASPAVIASLLPAGVVALIANRRIVPRIETATAGLSAVPGAVAGSLLFPLVPAALISSFVVLLAVLSGVHAICTVFRAGRGGRADDSGSSRDDQPSRCDTELATAAADGARKGGGAAAAHPSAAAGAFVLSKRVAVALGLVVGRAQ